MSGSLEFLVLSSGESDPPIHLSSPNASMIRRYSEGSYDLEGIDFNPDDDPYRAIDQFFERFDTGIIAGYLSYDLGAWNHELPLPESEGTEPPLLQLAHYTKSGRSYHGDTDSVRVGEFEPQIDRSEFEECVDSIRDSIRRGDVYQVNYSHRFLAPVEGTLRSLAAHISNRMISPRSVYVSTPNHEILSLSPERFLRIEGNEILTEPIKGTRSRGRTPHEDDMLREQLLRSEKDRAEHTMIVDLERNDLNRICKPGTVVVPEMAAHHVFPTVHHLVSTVKGTLESDVTPGQIFRHTFPGGSITGAPKHTALKIIDRLERRNRGIYTGTIGYWDLDRDVADWNVAIRTLVRYRDRVSWDSGCGIVYDSNSSDEYEESLHKTSLIRKVARSTRERRGTSRVPL